MNVWLEPVKMVVISSVVWLVLCLIAILLAGVSQRSSLLLTPAPRWPVLFIFAVRGCIAMKAGYWWVFQRVTFCGSR